MTKLYLDILDDARKSVFSRLTTINPAATLGGGTALALQINHRKSFDFDLFVPTPIQKTVYRTISEIFKESPIKRIDSTDQLTVQLTNNVEITVLYYWYPPLYPTIKTTSVPLFDRRDIATDKAFTIGKRNVWRDYVDFFYLLHEAHTTLSQIIEDAVKRFGNEFAPKLFLEQLTYVDDIVDITYTPVRTIHSKEEIQSYLSLQVSEYLKTILP